MNFTTSVNSTLMTCGLSFLPINPENISSDLRAIFIARIAVNSLTCPLIIVLNILVMVAVKTKRQLRTKSNIVLACLATSDLVVGLIVQPFHIINSSFLVSGQGNTFCNLNKVTMTLTGKCLMPSFTLSIFISAERYAAVRHPFAYESQVTEGRIIIASGLAWVIALLLPIENGAETKTDFVSNFVSFIVLPVFFYLPTMIYFNCVVYKEVRRSEKQIAANQVSLEAKKKLLKNKKAFYTTAVVLLAFFLCYIPINIFFAIFASITNKNSVHGGQTALYLLPLIPVLNSLLNPLIYAVRIRYFRAAFIQLLSRKTISQAEELERKIFGPKQIGVTGNVVQPETFTGSREDEQQGNETFNSGHNTTVRTQQDEELEEKAL